MLRTVLILLAAGCGSPQPGDVVFEMRAAALTGRVDAGLMEAARKSSLPRRVLFTYRSPPGTAEAQAIERLGGVVLRRWDRAAWTILAEISPVIAVDLAGEASGLQWAELDAGGQASLMNAAVQLGARSVQNGSRMPSTHPSNWF